MEQNYGLCFLTLASELELNCAQHAHAEFIPALARVIETVGLHKVALSAL